MENTNKHLWLQEQNFVQLTFKEGARTLEQRYGRDA